MIPATTGEDAGSSGLQEEQLCRRFSLTEIQSATQDFNDSLVIGRGGFGKVYKGLINNGVGNNTVAAIKRLDSSSKQGATEFWSEIRMLSKLRHCHLVSLLGYCNDSGEHVLVYEYMPRGTLDDHLHKLSTHLSWVQRLKICLGAARGLDYLHTGTGTQHGVIHRDLKSSNILLDESWAAKISDFGLSKIGPTNQPSTYVNTLVKGTFGYLDPDYFLTGRLTRKSDVYAFGVVMFEVLCGRRAVDTSLDEEQLALVRWAQFHVHRGGRLDHMICPNLRGQILPKCLKVFAQTADRCLHSLPKQRPTMAEVVVSLELTLALQEKPNNSVQSARMIPFSKVVQKLFFVSAGEKSAHNAAKLSRNSENNIICSSLPKEDSGDVPPDRQTMNQDLKKFPFSELKCATRDFKPDMCMGFGRCGVVFKGWVGEKTYSLSQPGSGLAIAIKKIHFDEFQYRRDDELWLQSFLKFLEGFRHSNLVKLLGYCFEDEVLFLVYELMQKGSLEHHLFYAGARPLPWATRIKIAIGAARGLAFLRTQKEVIGCQFQTSNILLDGDFNAKLSDFEVAKLLDDNPFTTGYFDPMYFAYPPVGNALKAGNLDRKCDIHGFGVLLLEILTGKRITSNSMLSEYKQMSRKELLRALDPRLGQDYPIIGSKFATLVRLCLCGDPKPAVSMQEVLKTLELISAQNENAEKAREGN